MNTKHIGDIATAKILAILISKYPVLLPFGDNQRYDLVFDDNGIFRRVQCKNGRYRKGCVKFKVCSVNRDTKETTDYKGQVDFFGVYCEETDKCYLVPIEKAGSKAMALRVDPLVRQRDEVNWAKEFEI